MIGIQKQYTVMLLHAAPTAQNILNTLKIYKILWTIETKLIQIYKNDKKK